MSRRFRRAIIATLGVFPIASNCPQSPQPLSRDVPPQGPLAFVRAIGLLGVVAASAQAPAPSIVRATRTRPIEVELVSASRVLVPGETTWVAVRLKPSPGWHTYWRYAGDVGSSFSAIWSLPAGWNAGSFTWPVPHRISSPPLASYGYEREQYLAAPIEVPRNARVGSTARIAARVTWVVCKEECVSDDVDLSIARPVAASAAIDSAVMSAIVA